MQDAERGIERGSMDADLPVDLLHWFIAISPIVALLVLLAVLRWKAPQAGPVGLFLTAATAMVFFRTPFETLAVGLARGIWDSIPILLVVWPALLLYRMGTRAGAFTAIRVGIQRFSRNDVFLIMAFGWVLASFMQGIAGFGAPIAVCAPLLVAIGVRPILAVAIPLIGHAWANMFGTLAVGWLATLQVVELENEVETAWQTAALLWIPNLLGALTIAFLIGRMQAVMHALPLILVISLLHGGGQLVLAFVSPVLSTFLAATAALIALYPLSKWSRYSEPVELKQQNAMKDDAKGEDDDRPEPVMSLPWALLPYGVLTVVAVGALVIAPIERLLGSWEVGFPLPGTTTGYGVENEATEAYAPFAPLTHPGTFLLLSALIGWLAYRGRGYFQKWEERTDPPPILRTTAADAIPASIAIVSFLALAQVLGQSGQTDVLALGISAVAPALVFAAAANLIGVIGAFMTSSNTASNVLFAPLQDSVAASEGLAQSGIIAAQSTGGAIGNAIAPANIVLGTSTAGAGGKEGAVLRMTLPWVAVTAVITGAATLFFV
jgi:lactate permease